MRKLAMLDASFLYLETAKMPMNIGSVQKFVLSGSCEDFYQRLRTTLARRAPEIGFLSCKLKATPFNLDHPVWVFDPAFDIDQHLVRIKLRGKGSQRQLERRVAECHEEPLPRDRPLWKYYLIEGASDGTVVLFEKYHHACFDGVAGQKVMDLLFTEKPDGQLPLRAAQGNQYVEAEPDGVSMVVDAALSVAAQFSSAVQRAPQMLGALGRLVAGAVRDEALRGRVAPKTPFNTSISPYRSWTCATISITEAKAVAKANECSLNDLFLAVCAGGLVTYLQRGGALPDAPLLCGVPVSLRGSGNSIDGANSQAAMNNSVGMLVTSLATHKGKPLNRLAAIARSMRSSKAQLADTAALTPEEFHMPGIGGVFSLAAAVTGLTRLADVVPPPVNLIISNVPGPRTTRYLCGAELLTHYPVSIPGDGMALNITCQSYVDRLDIGFTACLETVPDLPKLRNDTLAAWRELARCGGAAGKAHSLSGSITA